MPCSVPRYSSFARLMSSRIARAKSFGADAVDDLRPGLAEVVGLVDVRLEVVQLIAVRRDVGGAVA